MSPRYEIRIAGQIDETAAVAFACVNVIYHGSDTLLRGELDQAALHGVLERIRALGLDLVEARRVRSPVSPDRDPALRHRRDRLPEGAQMAGGRYEIRVAGSLGPAGRQAFSDVVIDVEPVTTVLRGDLDQVGLHALLDRVRALGLELIDIRQVPDAASA